MDSVPTLKQRTTATIGDYGRTRIPVDHWRELGEPEQMTVDLVEVDGSLEIRLHPKDD